MGTKHILLCASGISYQCNYWKKTRVEALLGLFLRFYLCFKVQVASWPLTLQCLPILVSVGELSIKYLNWNLALQSRRNIFGWTYPGFLIIQVKFFHNRALKILAEDSFKFFFQLLCALSSCLYVKSSSSDGCKQEQNAFHVKNILKTLHLYHYHIVSVASITHGGIRVRFHGSTLQKIYFFK